MRTITSLALAALLALTTAPAQAADNEQVTKILNYARVTEQHKILKKLAGSWRGTGSLINSQGGVAEKILCKSTNKMVLGGRFVEQKTTCKGAGFSFDGIGYFGYDVLSRSYIGTSMTTADSGISTLKGRRSGNTITFNITHNNVDVKKRVTSRATLTINDSGHKYEILSKDKSGKLQPILSIKYAR